MPRLSHLIPATVVLLLAAPALAAQQEAPAAPEPRSRPSVEEREALERKLLVEDSAVRRRDLARMQRALEEQRVLLRDHAEIRERELARAELSLLRAKRLAERSSRLRSAEVERQVEEARRMLERYHRDRVREVARDRKTVEL